MPSFSAPVNFHETRRWDPYTDLSFLGIIKRIAYGYKNFEYFALKLKAAFPGRGSNPLLLLGEWTAVIKSRLCHTAIGMERERSLFFN